MRVITLRRRTILLCFLATPFFAASGLFLASTRPPQADSENTLILSSSDGYELSDCLADGKPCGKSIADAWCYAHGHGTAHSFGRVRDTSASNSPTSHEPAAADLIMVRCRK